MLLSQQSDHDGWNVYTVCDEANPVDWSPGKPQVYAVHGFAEFARPHEYQPGFRSTVRINYPCNGKLEFFDFNTAHNHVQAELKRAIDALKVPAQR